MSDVPRNFGYSNQWSNPLFSTYGSPLAEYMTQWIYGDRQSNPYADQPSEWPRTGRIAYIDRVLTFSLTSATPVVTTANLGGGKNILVFSRSATLSTTTPFAQPAGAIATVAMTPLPNDLGNYVSLQIKRQDGFIDMETAPVNNNFGVSGRPFIRPSPEFWLGTQSREFTATNTSGISLTLSIVFQIALLDTGR